MSSPVLARQKFEVQIGIEEDDIVGIYEGGVSSSIVRNSSASKEWRPLHEATNGKFHTVKFYDAHPQIGVAWVKLPGGYVLARAIVWREDPLKPWTQYGWPYYDGQIFGNLLINWLKSQGIRPKDDKDTWRTKPFRIKGYNIPEFGRVFCPVPYLDQLDPMWVEYNEESEEFLFTSEYKNGRYICDGSSHCGYITSLSPRMQATADEE
jgi:hypothetical protein